MEKIQGFARVGICKILHSMHTLLTCDNLPFIIIRVINVHIFILIRLPPSDNLLSPLGVICLHLQKMQCIKSPTIRLKELQDDFKGWRKGFFYQSTYFGLCFFFISSSSSSSCYNSVWWNFPSPSMWERAKSKDKKLLVQFPNLIKSTWHQRKKIWWNFATWWQKKGPCNKYKGFFGKRKIGPLSWHYKGKKLEVARQ